MEGAPRSRRRKTQVQHATEQKPEEIRNVIRASEFISIAELSDQMGVIASEVIARCLEMGLMVSINQRLDVETLTMVADEFGYDVEVLEEYTENLFAGEEEERTGPELPRGPVVTVMGHVDHGKTSLLDTIRRTNVVAGESGGITQHIGAYEVKLAGGKIAFLDTPGHEAFTAMRSRGAQATDIVILVVAADDHVMPQTIEAIDHARAAEVPIVVAINKIDLPTSDPERIRQELSHRGVLVEEWGGKTITVEVSAKTGAGIERLLEMVLLEAELMELTANPDRKARGVIIEAELHPGRGAVATVLIQDGTLRVGDAFVTGLCSGRVRALLDERGQGIAEAGPSTPVQVLGIESVPQAGDSFIVLAEERKAREISQKRRQLKAEHDARRREHRMTLADFHRRIEEGQVKDLGLILKADVDGSVEALSSALMELSTEEVRIKVIHSGVGAISESDVLLAAASDAIVIGFHVRPDVRARELAAREHVDIRLYRVIYETVEDVKAALSGLLPPEISENILGAATIREIFRVPSIGVIAGSYVQSGTLRRNASARVLRDHVVIFEGKITSLRRFKDDVREVATGYECGIGVANFNDLKLGDMIEAFEVVETARHLD
ncbi:MAG: translation initiation factor IF-2 [Candidatus Latescibacterota bacterium]